MPGIPFSKLLPGGNSTIILTGTHFHQDVLSALSKKLMDPAHLQAEQVGELRDGQDPPHLQMMGGEFCVNATRAASFLLAVAGRLSDFHGCLGGRMTVSGLVSPLQVLVADSGQKLDVLLDDLAAGKLRLDQARVETPAVNHRFSCCTFWEDLEGEKAVSLYCAARVPCSEGLSVRPLLAGAHVVDLPGISHILLDAAVHPRPDEWFRETGTWRSKAGLEQAEAAGVVWYERSGEGFRIWPVVRVEATGTECMETACGSASLAVALLHLNQSAAEAALPEDLPGPLEIVQPSAESLQIRFQLFPDGADSPGIPVGNPFQTLTHAWVSGKVTLIAEGTAYI